MSEQCLKQNAFLTCSLMFLRSNTLEQFKFKLEKITGIQKHAGKVKKKKDKIFITNLATVVLRLKSCSLQLPAPRIQFH